MPEKPDNEMDEMLQAYAKQRRDNPEVRMHPATKRMLQGEVKRTYGEAGERSGWQVGKWWRNFWPYLAVTAVLAFIVVELVIPGRQEPGMTVAKKDAEEERAEVTPEKPERQVQPEPKRAEPAVALPSSPAPVPNKEAAAPLVETRQQPLAGDSLALTESAPAEVQPAEETASAGMELARSIPPPARLESKSLPLPNQERVSETPAQTNLYFRQAPQELDLALSRDGKAPALETVRLADEVVTIAPPVQTSSAVQSSSAVPTVALAAGEVSNEVQNVRMSNAPAQRMANTESNAQELAQRAWEARMRELATPARENPERRNLTGATSAPSAAATSVATAAAQKGAASVRPTATVNEAVVQLGAAVQQATAVSAQPEAAVQQLAKAEAPLVPVVITSTPPVRLDAGEQYQLQLARMTELTNLGAAQRTWFLQSTNPADNIPAAFLPNFNMERLGDEVRFVDADGSVYLGRISRQGVLPEFEPVTGRALGEFDGVRRGSRFAAIEAVPDDLVITNAAVYDFAVEGTNLTLGVPVTVRGKYVERTNTPSMKGIAGVAAGPAGAPEAGRAARVGIPKSKAAILGAAVIGGTNTVQFKALSPEP